MSSPVQHQKVVGSNLNIRARPLKIIFVIGAPASGKGTLCKILSNERGYFHLSVGDHLRKLVQQGETSSEEESTADFLKPYLAKNELVPTGFMMDMINSKIIQERVKGTSTFLIDGFPRREEAAILFEEKIGEPNIVLQFDCPRAIALERFLLRKRDSKDTVDVFMKRYAEYERLDALVEERYAEKEILRKIDASGPTERTLEKLLAVEGL